MGDRKESRKRFIKRTMQRIEDNTLPICSLDYWQKQPYTAARLTMILPGWKDASTGLGFSKVCWPDEWDAEKGKQIALKKAISSLWRQVMDLPLFEEN